MAPPPRPCIFLSFSFEQAPLFIGPHLTSAMSSWDHLFGYCHSACSGINPIILLISSKLVGGFLDFFLDHWKLIPSSGHYWGRGPRLVKGLASVLSGDSYSHLGPSQDAGERLVRQLRFLKCEVRWLSTRHHSQKLPEWLLRPSFSSESGSYTNRSFSWSGTPPPSAILDSGEANGPITK